MKILLHHGFYRVLRIECRELRLTAFRTSKPVAQFKRTCAHHQRLYRPVKHGLEPRGIAHIHTATFSPLHSESPLPPNAAQPRDNVTALQANPQILASQTATANRHDDCHRTRGVRASSDSECAPLRKKDRMPGFIHPGAGIVR